VSAKGALRLDDPTNDSLLNLRRYTTADGLTSNLVSTISEDSDGRIYLGTAISVDRIDLETGRVRQYTVADGLVSNEAQSVYRDRHGSIWFGTTDGLSHLIPEADRSTVPPPIFIGGLSVAGVPHPISQLGEVNVVLPELTDSQNQVRVDFFGLDFAPGKVLRYQFKLEGADRDWSAILDQRSVNYANLKFGSYRFLVRAVNADGIASIEPAVVTFTIVPPLWLRWWFIVFMLLLLTITVHLIYRYHTRRLLELERVRTRIATDLHDDIGASLSKIAILSEVAAQDGGKPESDGPLTQIADTSRDMVDAMSDIVWAVNPQRDHLSDLTYRMRRFAEDLLDARDIEFTFKVPPHEKDVRLGADMRREVYLIFKECVNNLVKHSRCTRAELEFVIAGATLVINVNDNGAGFDVEGSRKNSGLGGHGLSSIERRASALGGSFVIKSESEKGTQISLKVPIVHGLRRRWWLRNYPNGR
jgi:signal transduction histidine kinase